MNVFLVFRGSTNRCNQRVSTEAQSGPPVKKPSSTAATKLKRWLQMKTFPYLNQCRHKTIELNIRYTDQSGWSDWSWFCSIPILLASTLGSKIFNTNFFKFQGTYVYWTNISLSCAWKHTDDFLPYADIKISFQLMQNIYIILKMLSNSTTSECYLVHTQEAWLTYPKVGLTGLSPAISQRRITSTLLWSPPRVKDFNLFSIQTANNSRTDRHSSLSQQPDWPQMCVRDWLDWGTQQRYNKHANKNLIITVITA